MGNRKIGLATASYTCCDDYWTLGRIRRRSRGDNVAATTSSVGLTCHGALDFVGHGVALRRNSLSTAQVIVLRAERRSARDCGLMRRRRRYCCDLAPQVLPPALRRPQASMVHRRRYGKILKGRGSILVLKKCRISVDRRPFRLCRHSTRFASAGYRAFRHFSTKSLSAWLSFSRGTLTLFP